jgi:hypothetical protein
VPSSGVIDLAIGLTFVFGVTAALASFATELIARLIGLRAAYLLSGLAELVDGGAARTDLSQAARDYENVRDMIRRGAGNPAEPGPPAAGTPSATGALLGGPILGNQGMTGQVTGRTLTLAATGPGRRLPKMAAGRTVASLWSQRRSLPSYIPARSFAEAVIDLVAPAPGGPATMTAIRQGIGALPPAMSPFKPSLEALAKNAGDDVSRFRASVERWYDDHMDRVSGWYKRRVAAITLAAGAILVLLLNVNALTIARTLYTESTVSAAISGVAAKVTSCPPAESQPDCLADVQARLSAAAAAGLPIGWGTVSDCRQPEARCNWLDQRGIFSRHGNSGGQLALVLIGFLIVIIALVPGARFWFGLLSKLSVLRATGPKPAPDGSR